MLKKGKRVKILRGGVGGYTLVEVVMSLAIIAIFFVLFQAAAGTIILNRFAKNQDLALRIAQNQLESLRLLGYENLPVSGPVGDPQVALLPGGQASLEVADYNNKIKQATVTVTWQDSGTALPHTIAVVTLIGDGGL